MTIACSQTNGDEVLYDIEYIFARIIRVCVYTSRNFSELSA